MGERGDAVSLDKRPRGFIASELNLAENTIRDVPALPLRAGTSANTRNTSMAAFSHRPRRRAHRARH